MVTPTRSTGFLITEVSMLKSTTPEPKLKRGGLVAGCRLPKRAGAQPATCNLQPATTSTLLHYFGRRQIRLRFHPGGMQLTRPLLFARKSNIVELLDMARPAERH